MMSMPIAGSVVLVTGASGGIGFEIAAQAAEAGAHVCVHGSSESSVACTIERLRTRAPDATYIPGAADFTEEGAIRRMVDGVAEVAGRLDAVIDCAITPTHGGISGVFANLDPAVFAAQCIASLATVHNLCHSSIPHLSRQGGAFVAFASDAGRFAAPRQALIGSTRAGIMGFVRNIAVELARDKIRVNCISPSFVEGTPVFDRFSAVAGGRAEKARQRAGLGLPRPEDIAPLALFLCGPHATKITGQVISVNGGLNA